MTKEEWEAKKKASPVRIQWDPERDLLLQPLKHKAIQIGLSGEAVNLYVNQWICRITDVTDMANIIREFVILNKLDKAQSMLPKELPYSLSAAVENRLRITNL